MGQRNDWIRKLSDNMYFTTEPFPGIPLVEISGDRRILIENHKGIIRYGKEKICVKVKFGTVAICGEKLSLAYMTGEKLVICGEIESVTLIKGSAI